MPNSQISAASCQHFPMSAFFSRAEKTFEDINSCFFLMYKNGYLFPENDAHSSYFHWKLCFTGCYKKHIQDGIEIDFIMCTIVIC
jgi:hypothetical protein